MEASIRASTTSMSDWYCAADVPPGGSMTVT
jgi:hypothetical protein